MAPLDGVSSARTPLGGHASLLLRPNVRVLLTDDEVEGQALAALAPSNAVVWLDAVASATDLSPLAGRQVLIWPAFPFSDYWRHPLHHEFLQRLISIARDVRLFLPQDSVDAIPPSELVKRGRPDGLRDWIAARSRPADELAPARPDPTAETDESWAELMGQAQPIEQPHIPPDAPPTPPPAPPADAATGTDNVVAIRPKRKPPPQPAGSSTDTERWSDQMLRTATGTIKPCLANAITVLRLDQRWRGVLAHDEFARQTVAITPPPFRAARAGPWTDTQDIAAANWLQHVGVGVNKHTAADAVEIVAHDHVYHPVRDYLEALHWDGVQRLSTWLIRHGGATDNAYTRAASRLWAISAIARIMEPGCMARLVLVLEGEQDIGKSTLLRALGEPWYTDDLAKPESKDAAQQTMGAWIIEIPELAAIERSSNDEAKAFLARVQDRLRLPYDRRLTTAPRQCVFAGTVNPGAIGYLRDDTGGTRYLPVTVSRADFAAVRLERDQLWAEAVQAYRSAESWWITDAGIRELARTEQEQRRVADTWEQLVSDWVRQQCLTETTLSTVLTNALFVDIERQDQRAQRRAANALKAAGWRNTVVREGGQLRRVWVKQ